MKFPWQKGYKEEKAAEALALAKAQEELDNLSKSRTDEGEANGIDELEKALEEYENLDGLQKSKEDEEEEKKEKEKEAEEREMEKARIEQEREQELEKARETGEDEERLVEASHAFHDLAKSVEEVGEGLGEGLDLLAKGLGSNTDLQIKTARAVVTLSKSIDDKMGKILEMLGRQPVSTVQLGFQKSREETTGDKTSVADARQILIKAVTEDDLVLPSGLLSRLDTTKNVEVIPADLRDKYNIKA
jgi:hypothetical protein